MKTRLLYIFRFYLLGLISLLATACEEESREGMMDEPSMAKVAIVNVSTPNRPTAASAAIGRQGYLLSMDGRLLYNAALIPNKTTGYFLAEPGSRTFTADSTEIGPNVNFPFRTVNTVQLNAEAGKYYTVYYTGKVQSPEVLITTDNLTRPAAGKAAVRVINLAPDMPAADVVGKIVGAAGSLVTLFGNVPYKTDRPFAEINAGFYQLELREPGGASPLPTLTQNAQAVPLFIPGGALRNDFSMNFESGKMYTLVIRGYKTPDTVGQIANPLSVGALINVYW